MNFFPVDTVSVSVTGPLGMKAKNGWIFVVRLRFVLIFAVLIFVCGFRVRYGEMMGVDDDDDGDGGLRRFAPFECGFPGFSRWAKEP